MVIINKYLVHGYEQCDKNNQLYGNLGDGSKHFITWNSVLKKHS